MSSANKDKQDFIKEIHHAVIVSIASYMYAHEQTKGLLRFTIRQSFDFSKEKEKQYYGNTSNYFEIYDTKDNLKDFIILHLHEIVDEIKVYYDADKITTYHEN